MKKLFILFSATLLSATVWAQSPEKMSYQAVIRDASDNLITNQAVSMQVSILQGDVFGASIYVETQSATTNANGLLSVEIGSEDAIVVKGDFTSINWANGTFYLKTETDPTGGTNYTITGTSQLMSVPYAMHAKTAESITGGITETDPTYTASEAANITSGDITNLSNLSGVNTGDQDLSNYVVEKTYTIGLWPELGGYVFRISADGKHGLVAETQDQSPSNWYTAQDIISDPANNSTNGQKFMDWRLPTRYELNEMYSQKVSIGGFSRFYWSASEFDTSNAWIQDFLDGWQDINNKNGNYAVRAIRSF